MIGYLVVNTVAVIVAAELLPGVRLTGFVSAVVVAVVLGMLNTFVKPILMLLTLPVTIMTLGLFGLVLNALMVIVTSRLVTGFEVDGLGTAIWFSLVITVVGWFLSWMKS